MSISRDDLITSYLPLARAIARKMKNRLPSHLDIEDLVSAGYVGLVQAADRFDPCRKTSFSAFASYRIQYAIYDMFRRDDWVPRLLRQSARKSGEHLHDIIPFSAMGLRDLNQSHYVDSITQDYELDLVSYLLSHLDNRDRRVVSMRYLDGLDGKTIAAILRISTSRVSEINKKALRTMKRSA